MAAVGSQEAAILPQGCGRSRAELWPSLIDGNVGESCRLSIRSSLNLANPGRLFQWQFPKDTRVSWIDDRPGVRALRQAMSGMRRCTITPELDNHGKRRLGVTIAI